MLYTFENLSQKLTELGYPEVSNTGFRVIRRDLTQEEHAGNVVFRDDGIYLTVDGQEYKGYMYIKHPFIVRYGNRFPKFHITNCDVIQEQRDNGNFANRYFWHNSNLVDLIDAQTGDEFYQVTLELCARCRKQSSIIDYSNTIQFHSLLDQQEMGDINQDIEVDIFGYTLDWQKLSREFKKEKEYTCENCGIKIDIASDRRFIHAHHINGNKLNNNRSNLECLCVLCHANKDQNHQHNFERRRMQSEIIKFLEKYRDALTELGNQYL
jgi:hypothetical protein